MLLVAIPPNGRFKHCYLIVITKSNKPSLWIVPYFDLFNDLSYYYQDFAFYLAEITEAKTATIFISSYSPSASSYYIENFQIDNMIPKSKNLWFYYSNGPTAYYSTKTPKASSDSAKAKHLAPFDTRTVSEWSIEEITMFMLFAQSAGERHIGKFIDHMTTILNREEVEIGDLMNLEEPEELGDKEFPSHLDEKADLFEHFTGALMKKKEALKEFQKKLAAQSNNLKKGASLKDVLQKISEAKPEDLEFTGMKSNYKLARTFQEEIYGDLIMTSKFRLTLESCITFAYIWQYRNDEDLFFLSADKKDELWSEIKENIPSEIILHSLQPSSFQYGAGGDLFNVASSVDYYRERRELIVSELCKSTRCLTIFQQLNPKPGRVSCQSHRSICPCNACYRLSIAWAMFESIFFLHLAHALRRSKIESPGQVAYNIQAHFS